MESCLYEGAVRHRRWSPAPHAFRYRLFMVYLDLEELETVFRGRWLWSTRRPAVARLCREDHLGDPSVPLEVAVRDLVAERRGARPTGPIRLLTHLRYFGYVFNPVSLFYCFDASLVLERREIDGFSLASALSRHPWMTAKVIASIYREAWRLRRKGVPVLPHPGEIDVKEATA